MIIQISIRLFLLFLITILSACAGTDASSETISTDSPTVSTPGNTPVVTATVTLSTTVESPVTNNSSTPQLIEVYTGENELVNATLSLNYPSGWVTQGSGTSLLLASENPETITTRSDALIISISPVEGAMLANLTEISAETLVAQALRDTTGQTVTSSSIRLNNRNVASGKASFDSNSALVYAIQFDAEVFVLLSVIKAGDFTSDDEAIITAIAETIEYDAGAIPQSDE